jgi:MFS family permease
MGYLTCRYTVYALGAAAEFVALLVAGASLDHYGRRNTIAGGMLTGGAACFACAFATNTKAQAVWAALGKFGCTSKWRSIEVACRPASV